MIIGGHRKKAEKVLQYLPRMYMPMQNFQDLEPEVLEAYRMEGRDIRGIRSFSALVPEVFFFGDLSQRRLSEFLRLRLEFDRITSYNVCYTKLLRRLFFGHKFPFRF